MLPHFVSEVFLILTSLLLSIFVYYPLLLPLLAILLSYRQFVIWLAKKWHSSWLPISTYSESLAVDMLNENGMRCISVTIEFTKPLDPSKVVERVKLVLSRNKDPELTSYFTRWMGIYFLKPCPTLEMGSLVVVNPIKMGEGVHINQLVRDFLTRPFNPCHPLWQAMIFPNIEANKVVITLRAHHALLDGISIMQLFKEFADPDTSEDVGFQEKISAVMSKYVPPLPLHSKLLLGLELLLVTPPLFFYTTLKSININMWTNSGNSGELISHDQKFCSNRIRQIGSKFGVNGNVIFSAALTAAIREEMVARGDPSVDQDLSLMYVLPSPKHALKKFGNYVSVCTAVIPNSVGDVGPRLQRLEDMFRQIRRPARILQWDLLNGLSCLLISLLRLEDKPRFWSSGVWSNISSFEIEAGLTLFGKPSRMLMITLGPQARGVPIVFVSLKLRDQVLLYVNTYESVFPNNGGLQGFFKRVEHELEKLEKLEGMMQVV